MDHMLLKRVNSWYCKKKKKIWERTIIKKAMHIFYSTKKVVKVVSL